MKLLALDTSSLVASAAVVEDETLIAEYTVNYKKKHSQSLLPMIDEIVRMTELDLSDLDAVAVSAGPGSFTGLRIGSATAKGLAMVLDIPIVPVSTLEAMAYGVYGTTGVVCPLMDARRGQVYTGIYRTVRDSYPETVKEQMAISVIELLDILNDMKEPVTFLGEGFPVYREIIEDHILVPAFASPAHLSAQRAASVGVLGMLYLRDGRTVSAAEHVPVYLRMSQAERERLTIERNTDSKDADVRH